MLFRSSVIGMAISPAAKDPNMVIMYGVLAGAMGVTALLFWWRFRGLDVVDRELDQVERETERGDEER